MYRHLLILLILLVSSPMTAWAQTKGDEAWLKELSRLEKELPRDTIKKIIYDTPNLHVYYKKVYQPVPKMSQPRVSWVQVLQIGDTHRRFVNLAQIQADSLYDADIRANVPVAERHPRWSALLSRARVFGSILFDTKNKSLTFHDRVFLDYYRYEEPIPQLAWTQLPGDTTIIGYQCHKASTRFRGRDYIAWYCDELPIPYGPYKFNGLPGLILCIYDTDRDHHYSCIGIEQIQGKFIYEKDKKKEFVTKREALHKLKKNFCANPGTYRSPKITGGSAVRRNPILYNPIELE